MAVAGAAILCHDVNLEMEVMCPGPCTLHPFSHERVRNPCLCRMLTHLGVSEVCMDAHKTANEYFHVKLPFVGHSH